MQIVFVTQDLAQIAAFARQLVEQTFHHTKLSTVGARGSYRIDVFHGPVTGAIPPVSNRIREVFGKYRPQIFKLYKSHTMSDSKKSGADESAMDTRGSVWKRWQVWAGAAFAVACFVYGGTTLAGLIAGFGAPDSAVGAVPVAEPAPPAAEAAREARSFAAPVFSPTQRTEAKPLGVPQRSQYRVVGFVDYEDGEHSVALITDGKRVLQTPYHQCKTMTDGDLVCTFAGSEVGYFGARP